MTKKLTDRYKKVNPQSGGAVPMKNQKHYPTLYLSFKDLPIARNWKVGEVYEIGMKVKQTRVSENSDGTGEVGFDILAIKTE